MARYWDEDAFVRVTYKRFLATLDRCAERLLAEDVPGTSDAGSTASAGAVSGATVEVTFTLPAEVRAETVALCGEFNDWSADDTRLDRDPDGTWRTTVALQPGRSYRYRYLLDGQRWENARQADQYAPNPYGSVDSVIFVR